MASSTDTSPTALRSSSNATQLPSFDSFLRSAGQRGPWSIGDFGHGDVERSPVSPFGTRFAAHIEPSSRTASYADGERVERSDFGHWLSTTTAPSTIFDERTSSGTAPLRVVNNLQPPFLPHANTARGSLSSPLATLDISHAQPKYLIREENVPGKGPCYVYDDGSVVQTTINGEAVNPKWGTTKQGKPRKRLGQACNTCREKKIKCDPSVPKCAQCQKFNRECKFETSARSQVKSPQSRSEANSPVQTTPTDDPTELRRESSSSVDASMQILLHSGRSPNSSTSLENLLTPITSVDSSAIDDYEYRQSAKKRKTSVAPGSAHSDSSGFHPDAVTHVVPERQHDVAAFTASVDPWEVDPSLTMALLSQYFSQVNDSYNHILPRRAFLKWVKTNRDKTRHQCMLLYALMAFGSVFVKRTGIDSQRAMFENLAEDTLAQSVGEETLPMIQTRFILGYISFMTGDGRKGWDYTSTAMRYACELRFNSEEGVCYAVDGDHRDYDLPLAMLIESRRRTFWSMYAVLCYRATCLGFAGMVHKEDCLLRLPCREADFESGTIADTPFFLHRTGSTADDGQPYVEQRNRLGTLARLVEIASMTNDIVNHARRMHIRPSDQYERDFAIFHEGMKARLRAYSQSLRDMYQAASMAQTSKPKQSRFHGVGALHIFYHYASLLLNRFVRHADISPAFAEQCIHEAYAHAGDLLETVQQLHNHVNKLTSEARFGLFAGVLSPAILSAFDTITAAGSVSALLETGSRSMELLTAGIEMLDTAAEHWELASRVRALVKTRLQNILKTHNPAGTSKKTGFFSKAPLFTLFESDEDIVYGTSKMQYLRALGWGQRINSEADLYEIGVA